MTGFNHFDASAGRAVAIAGDHQAFERTLPMILDRLGHRATGLASADDDDAAWRPGREMRRQAFLRQGRAHRRLKHIEKQLTRIDGHCGFRFPRGLPGRQSALLGRPPPRRRPMP